MFTWLVKILSANLSKADKVLRLVVDLKMTKETATWFVEEFK
jgi:hypothetical protein